ncbi:hypothetical protein PMAYCL1PPCAC_21515 [Pristionchus mayeri]|uniref:Uncharacterized protein n=1 Tax=Pristionchus mayeri TaxID=1317129 RepID=A0AAN5CVL8_9BILA|nr:hypothetical protein PMAYCL1PPCAC_21515 [Pristionchus mayeri]
MNPESILLQAGCIRAGDGTSPVVAETEVVVAALLDDIARLAAGNGHWKDNSTCIYTAPNRGSISAGDDEKQPV